MKVLNIGAKVGFVILALVLIFAQTCHSYKLKEKDSQIAQLLDKTAINSTEDYTFDAVIQKDYSGKKVLHLNSVTVTDSMYLRVNELKGGLFKRNQEGKFKIFLRKSYQIQVIHGDRVKVKDA